MRNFRSHNPAVPFGFTLAITLKYPYTDKEYTVSILVTYTMRKFRTHNPAVSFGFTLAITLKYPYIDKEYTVFILATCTMRKYAKFKKTTTRPYRSVSRLLMLIIALKATVHYRGMYHIHTSDMYNA